MFVQAPHYIQSPGYSYDRYALTLILSASYLYSRLHLDYCGQKGQAKKSSKTIVRVDRVLLCKLKHLLRRIATNRGKAMAGNGSTYDPSTSLRNPSGGLSVVEIAKATACFTVIFISLVGNSMVIISVKKNLLGKMRTVNNYFIANMSLADLLFSIQNIFSVVTYIIFGGAWKVQGDFGQACCKLDMFSTVVLMLATVLSLLAIAMDRFFAVFYPMKKLVTARVGNIVLILTWLLSALYSAPLLYFSELKAIGAFRFCDFKEEASERFFQWYTVQTTIFALALLIILIVYTAISIKLLKSKLPGAQSENTKRRRAKRNRDISKMLVTLVVVFYVCFLPFWVVQLSSHFGFLHLIRNTAFHFISNLLLLTSGAVNPFIYVIFNPYFRMSFRYFGAKVCCCCHQRVAFNINSYPLTSSSYRQSETRL